MTLPRFEDVTDIDALAEALDAADHDERVKWIRRLGEKAQRRLYEMAEGRPVDLEELVGDDGELVRHVGKNGLPLFNRFEKCFARLGDQVVGYNRNNWIVQLVTGPGHYLAYPSPNRPGEIWIDYRRLPTVQHPDVPPLRSNERGIPALVFGNMVDVLRRVSKHVTIGDAFKNFDREEPQLPVLVRVGAALPTAPFVLCRAP